MLVATRFGAYLYIFEKWISSEDITFENFNMSLIATIMSLIAYFKIGLI